jgi:hypothetical protein
MSHIMKHGTRTDAEKADDDRAPVASGEPLSTLAELAVFTLTPCRIQKSDRRRINRTYLSNRTC